MPKVFVEQALALPGFSKNKGFINYVFCRNWAVRNRTGTMLDSSSLVNKQVDLYFDYNINFTV